jgi:hypothetical protein
LPSTRTQLKQWIRKNNVRDLGMQVLVAGSHFNNASGRVQADMPLLWGESFLMRSLLVTIIQAYFNGAKAEITIEI